MEFRSLEKRLAEDQNLRENKNSPIKGDEGYVLEVQHALEVENQSNKNWYRYQQLLLNPIKLVKVLSVLNRAADFKFYGALLINFPSVALFCFPTLFVEFSASDNSYVPSLPTLKECFYSLGHYHRIKYHFGFFDGRTI